jgi:AcrR family transcriptional regulator
LETTRGARDKILNAILELLVVNQLSYNEISIAGICRKAKVTRKTFYYHFSNKDEAAKTLVNVQIEKTTEKFDYILHSPLTFTNKLAQLQDIFLTSYREEFTRELINRLNADAPEIMKEHNMKMSSFFEKMKELIIEGQKQGVVKTNIEPEVAVSMLYTVVISLNSNDINYFTNKVTEEMMHQAFEIVLNGIMKNEIDTL